MKKNQDNSSKNTTGKNNPLIFNEPDYVGGPLTAPFDPDRLRYDVRAVLKYIQDNNIGPEGLTEEEFQQFITK